MCTVRSNNIKNFLYKYGIEPVYEEYETAYYKRTPALLELLEAYQIRYQCFPNRVAR